MHPSILWYMQLVTELRPMAHSVTEVEMMAFLLYECSKSSPWPVFIIAEWGMPDLSHTSLVENMLVKESVL